MATDQGTDGPVIFFDGVCGLCNHFVDFILSRDPAGRYRFATLQGETASRLAVPDRDVAGTGRAEDGYWMRSLVLQDADGLHRKSDAALRVLGGLGGVWRLAALLRLVPRPLRDAVYDIIARNRYQWFGKREACRMPTALERARFLP